MVCIRCFKLSEVVTIKDSTRQRILTIACCVVVVGSLAYIFSDGPPLPLPTPYSISTSSLESGQLSSIEESIAQSSASANSETESIQAAESTLESQASSSNASSTPTKEGDTTSSNLASDTVTKKININTASEKELTALPGIGEVIAKRIVEYRTNTKSFASIDELMNVSGIGEKKFAALRDYVIV